MLTNIANFGQNKTRSLWAAIGLRVAVAIIPRLKMLLSRLLIRLVRS